MTSTLVMDALFCGCKLVHQASTEYLQVCDRQPRHPALLHDEPCRLPVRNGSLLHASSTVRATINQSVQQPGSSLLIPDALVLGGVRCVRVQINIYGTADHSGQHILFQPDEPGEHAGCSTLVPTRNPRTAQNKGRAPSVTVDAATSVFRLGCDAVDLLQLAASQASVPPPPRDVKHGEPLGRQSQACCFPALFDAPPPVEMCHRMACDPRLVKCAQPRDRPVKPGAATERSVHPPAPR